MGAVTTRQLQSVFAHRIAKLILRAEELGFEVTCGEFYRSPEEAERLDQEAKGRAIKRSLHCDRLAADLLLFKNGIYLTASEDYTALGLAWEAMSDAIATCTWGGQFDDGNHFSIAYQGRK